MSLNLPPVGLEHFLFLAGILFSIAVAGIFLNRKNVILLLMCIELMLLSVNFNFVAFSQFYSRQGAAFQAGTLFLDGRSSDLTVDVANPAAHATLAGMGLTRSDGRPDTWPEGQPPSRSRPASVASPPKAQPAKVEKAEKGPTQNEFILAFAEQGGGGSIWTPGS
jgi:hypothetical protein